MARKPVIKKRKVVAISLNPDIIDSVNQIRDQSRLTTSRIYEELIMMGLKDIYYTYQQLTKEEKDGR